ncbi:MULTISPECIES: alpha/beta fold hydrolase [Alicyclobacillus]|uniref:Alpha/beta hydrolase n=1 Tax=Alicyclobacillus acidoterrestris (strain ATCC 49025 / DSM 3922 / CIP 106132 / NCIMB 13137 / GD3B) TaxID=1356854 RepID=T0BTU0_ALIAG|nr:MULTISPECIES: alpha/beta hydrolase [Alicyclobacillus]EPZ47493.1 hypothetical protein N007_06035 [Alicyclobacillus acidoterrestris ATCC 49025]UNO48582.1 alpha/beta hydrolase [Alicyclobacillus acidoterrestris]
MPVASVNGADIYYEVLGEGRPLVLVMGLGGNLDWWGTGFRKRLARARQVIAFDNRGSGRTKAPAGPIQIEQMADDLASLLDALSIDQADVFGVSMGGMISQEFALRHPHRLHKLILGCTSCGGSQQVPPTKRARELLMAFSHSQSEEDAMAYHTKLLFPEAFIEQHWDLLQAAHRMMFQIPTTPDNFERQLHALEAWPGTYERLPSIAHPTLLLHGTADILLPAQNSELMEQRLPSARYIAYEGCGHGFMVQAAQQVISDVDTFLAE